MVDIEKDAAESGKDTLPTPSASVWGSGRQSLQSGGAFLVFSERTTTVTILPPH